MPYWVEVLALLVGGAGLAYGAYRAAQNPMFWVGLTTAVLQGLYPFLAKQLSPADLEALHQWLREGGRGQFVPPSKKKNNHAGENH